MHELLTTKERITEEREKLSQQGWYLFGGLDSVDAASELLEMIGPLMPQYDGDMTNPVRSLDGLDNMHYSRSNNNIGPHTEAPYYEPPPQYQALYCHQQAACGGGQTLLADGYEFIETLNRDLLALAMSTQFTFQTSIVPTETETLASAYPMVSVGEDDRYVFRFSHNFFFYGDVNTDAIHDSSEIVGVTDPQLQEIIHHCVTYFQQHALAILIPQHALLVWDNYRMLHSRNRFMDKRRWLTRFWLQ